MTKHLSQIGKQLMIFALIASVFNIYALEIWCGLTMGSHNQSAGIENHLASGHSPNEMDHCPHKGNTNGTKNSCEDHHKVFLTTVSGSGFQKFFIASGDFNFTRPDHFGLPAARAFSLVTLPVKLFPDVGLKPKVPDIRIFICSLTI